jgi:hypothetical protein
MPGSVGPILDEARYKEALIQTQEALLQTALAIHAYKVDHGAYPKAPADFCPTYLPAVLSDPFALKAELHYNTFGFPPFLYSIGPDGMDNNGLRNGVFSDQDLFAAMTSIAAKHMIGDIVVEDL